MPTSMTGYGRAELKDSAWSVLWEIKSVNGRYLDVKWKIPSFIRCLEQEFEKILRMYAARGRVDISLNLETADSALLGIQLDMPRAKAMFAQIETLAKEFGQEFVPDFSRVIGTSYLWHEQESEPAPMLKDVLRKGLEQACHDWNLSRQAEGEALNRDLLGRITCLETLAGQIAQELPSIVEEKKAVLSQRFTELLANAEAQLVEERVLQEIAVLVDKLDVSEELIRLEEHLKRMREVLGRDGDIGKRLDFLCQETFREINTCGNKVQSAEISALIVEFKAELEKCREQIQNVE